MKKKTKEQCQRMKNRNEMQKPPQTVRCTLLNNSARSTERNCMRRYKDTVDVFFWN